MRSSRACYYAYLVICYICVLSECLSLIPMYYNIMIMIYIDICLFIVWNLAASIFCCNIHIGLIYPPQILENAFSS